MIPWWLSDPNRYAAEVAALHALETDSEWLRIDATRVDDQMRICVDLTMKVRGSELEGLLRFPQTFPFTPPSVLPRVAARWSEHQYGSGELCLEYGPDNWRPELTGADMVCSAERLLSAEGTPEGGQAALVPSRHDTTAGQDLRSRWSRLLVTGALKSHLAEAPRGQTTKVEFLTLNRTDTYVIVPKTIESAVGETWSDPGVPPLAHFAVAWHGLGFGLPPGVPLPTVTKTSSLEDTLRAYGFQPAEGFKADGIELLLVWADEGPGVYWLRREADEISRAALIESGGGQRLDVGHAALAKKTVGLVGCGSAGSKLAVSLARSGVRSFTLIDDDVLLPENLVRQDLDWLSMGEHKADALARRLTLAAPGTTATVRRQHLGGQEASGGVDWALSRLQDCDLIIDATADPAVFNLLAAVAAAATKPLLWLEIFAGGIGGLIARSRPGLDPSPQTARARIDGWCAARGIAAPRPTGGYEADSPAGPLIADDADVAVIAAHATRFAVDILLGRAPSAFPHSAYLIGLAEAWLFSEPFHTLPLDLGDPEAKPAPEAPNPDAVAAIVALLSLGDNATAPSA
jgi:hypothetical protein